MVERFAYNEKVSGSSPLLLMFRFLCRREKIAQWLEY